LSLQTWKNFDITVTEDGSTDGTYEAIRQQFPEVTVLCGDGNLWWTGAINMALEYILPRAEDGDYILTLNNDVTFQEDYLGNLAEAANVRPGWLIGSVSLDKDNPERVVNAGVYVDWRTRKRTMGRFKQGPYFNDHVNRLSGRGALIPVKVYHEVGLYDSRHLPHYAGDTELAIRAKCRGFSVCIYYNAIVMTDTSVSGYKFTPFTKVSFRKAFYLLFSNKAVSQIKTRFNFTLLSCPHRYLLRNLFAESFNVLQIVTSVPPIWHVKILFRPLLKRFQCDLCESVSGVMRR